MKTPCANHHLEMDETNFDELINSVKLWAAARGI